VKKWESESESGSRGGLKKTLLLFPKIPVFEREKVSFLEKKTYIYDRIGRAWGDAPLASLFGASWGGDTGTADIW
jgi:hypothetical protein